MARLADWTGPAFTLTNELYLPSAMFASGRGFIRPPVDEVPGMRDFLYLVNGTNSWGPRELPETFSRTHWDTYERYHRYLIYSMGFIWRLFGISWDSAKILAIGLHAVTTLLVYALTRQLMSWPFAFVVALLYAHCPAAVVTIFNIRDYSKAPFIVGLLVALVYLLALPRARKPYFIAALAAGAAIGIGLGFRRDLLIAFPPAILVILCCPLQGGGIQLARRFSALVIMLTTAVLLASPILGTFRDKGSLVSHDIIMGMATISDTQIGLRPAEYERVPVKHDILVSGLASTYGQRMLAARNPGAAVHYSDPGEPAKSDYLVETIKLFPADMLLRGYAACLRIFNGAGDMLYTKTFMPERTTFWFQQIARFDSYIETSGWMYVLTAFLIGSALNPRLAIALAVLILYFCGITSMQFETRHAFHMAFIPAAALIFCFYVLWSSIKTLRNSFQSRRKVGGSVGQSIGMAFWIAARGLYVTTFLLVALVMPWFATLVWQNAAITSIESQLRDAQLKEIPTHPVVHGTWLYRTVDKAVPQILPEPAVERPYYRPVYLMLEFESFPGYSPIQWLVSNEDGMQDYSQLVRAAPFDEGGGQLMRYYCNVPEMSGGLFNSWFDAVGFPAEYADRFRGLYLVENVGPIGTNCNFSLPVEGSGQRRYQTLARPLGQGFRYPDPPGGLPGVNWEIQQMHRRAEGEDWQTAKQQFVDALGWGILRPEIYLALADIYAREGNLDARRDILLRALRDRPLDWGFALAYESMVLDSPPEAALSLWQTASEIAARNTVVVSRLNSAQEQARAAESTQPPSINTDVTN